MALTLSSAPGTCLPAATADAEQLLAYLNNTGWSPRSPNGNGDLSAAWPQEICKTGLLVALYTGHGNLDGIVPSLRWSALDIAVEEIQSAWQYTIAYCKRHITATRLWKHRGIDRDRRSNRRAVAGLFKIHLKRLVVCSANIPPAASTACSDSGDQQTQKRETKYARQWILPHKIKAVIRQTRSGRPS